MKTLFLVRHGKSDWNNPEISDYERPLNNRGLRDAPFMGKLLRKNGVAPDKIFSSSAVRAITTAKLIAEELDIKPSDIIEFKSLYDSMAGKYANAIEEADDSIQSLMVVGHNPTITDLAERLSNRQIGEMPTCSIVGIAFNISNWSSLLSKAGQIVLYESPKKYLDK